MSQKDRKKVVLSLPPNILSAAQLLAEQKDMTFDAYVSDVVWVAVASHRQRQRELEDALMAGKLDSCPETEWGEVGYPSV